MNNKIYCEFACNKGVIYEVVDGITLNEEYSETLDSMSIVLDNVEQSERLTEIEPYTYVRVYGTGDFSFSKIMLVDNYVETEKNIISHIYSYQISLMSELKLLEKCQCPNLAITHSLTTTRQSIYHYINLYMSLYAPKVKQGLSGSYSYSPIFSFSSRIASKFASVECADFSMNCPTLRQVITSLMLQVNCIPTIKNGVLDYLDLKEANPNEFEPDETIVRITKSMSSDSFVNSLSYIGNQVLDSGNEVISEYLGFRDRDNALIKSTENLYLNTSFPIYKVNSLKILLKGKRVRLLAKNSSYDWSASIPYIGWSLNGNYDKWTITINGGSSSSTIKNFKIHLIKSPISFRESLPVLDEFKVYYVDNWQLTETRTTGSNSIGASETKTIEITDTTYESGGLNNPAYAIWVEFDSTNEQYGKDYILFPPNTKSSYIHDLGYFDVEIDGIGSDGRAICKFDITPLCVENAKRSQLEVDFSAMQDVDTIEALSQYYYGTVGYSIGSTKISGFSQTYSKKIGWWDDKKTYIENIISVIEKAIYKAEQSGDYSLSLVDVSEVDAFCGYPMEYVAIPSDGLDDETFGSLSFELKYQPLNEFNITFLKDSDNPLRISQYDSGNGGVQDFDRLTANMTDKTNRLGNDVLVIMQTTDDASKLIDILGNGVVSYGDYQIFKRTLSIRNHRISATYYASKGYVMQNYFTAITTKYRAYENVDYEASTKRRENLSRYLLITENTHSFASDGNLTITGGKLSAFASGMVNEDDSRKIRYAVSYDAANSRAFINEVSSITAKNTIAFSYNQFDNVMAGIRLKTSEPDSGLGGIEQEWLPLSDNFQYANRTYFASFIPFNEDLNSALEDMITAPEITRMKDDCVYEIKLFKGFEKDKGETLSITLQVELYTDSSNIEWTDAMLENCQYISVNDYHPNMVSINRSDALSDKERQITLTESQYSDLLPSDVLTFGNNSITINWALLGASAKTLRISHWEAVSSASSQYTRKVIDYVEFKRNPENASTQTFHTYLNDNKSLKVMYRDSNGLLYVSSTI